MKMLGDLGATIWSLIFLLPLSIIFEKPWLEIPTFSFYIIVYYYLGGVRNIFWLIRFKF